MIKILSYPFSLLAYSSFLLALLIFQPIQWICLRLFGYQAHKVSVDILSFFLTNSLLFIFSRSSCNNLSHIPTGKPIIFVSNHQGTFDIATMSWYLRKFHPKYVSKIELGKNIPSVSFNLKHGGSILIDRENPRQALPLLKQMGEYINQHNRSAIIFPEGTRSKDGRPKNFAPNGLKILCKYAPDALVVPVTINNSWKLFKYGAFPLHMGLNVSITVHNPVSVRDSDFDNLFEQTQKTITEHIKF